MNSTVLSCVFSMFNSFFTFLLTLARHSFFLSGLAHARSSTNFDFDSFLSTIFHILSTRNYFVFIRLNIYRPRSLNKSRIFGFNIKIIRVSKTKIEEKKSHRPVVKGGAEKARLRRTDQRKALANDPKRNKIIFLGR